MTTTIKSCQNMSDIADKYDVFFVDLWGVIHDGIIAYDGAADCLNQLHKAGKKVIFISNAPRRAIRAVEGLRRVGVEDHLYDHVITSGEVTYLHLTNENHEYGNKYAMIGPSRDDGLLEENDHFERVNNFKDASFVLVTGFDNDDSTLEELKPIIHEAKKYNLPMICANPDLIVVRNSGKQALCAGIIAQYYSSIGGKVEYFGKPHQKVYNKAMELAGSHNPERIAAIGDSLITDIKGGNKFGIDTYLIPGGILGESLGIKHGELPNLESLSELCNKEDNIHPKAVIPAFIW